MKFLPITSLAAWKHCPCSFYVSQVLKVKPELNSAMALGLTKHKLFELWHNFERKIAVDVSLDDISQRFSSEAVSLAQTAVRVQSASLKRTDVLLPDAFNQVLPLAKNLADCSVARFKPLLEKGVTGIDLWDAVLPKVKTEYSIKSESLRVKGRIDVLECFADRIVPVELKSGRVPSEGVFDTHRIQAACYAVVLEEMFNSSVPEAVVHYVDADSRRPVVLNPFLREELVSIAGKAHACLESKQAPKGCSRDSCDACCYVKNNV